MLVAVSGALLGLIMALIFIGHMSYAVVFNMPDAIEKRFKENEATALPRLVLVSAVAIVPAWALLGVGLALLSTALEDLSGTGFAPVPSIPYLAGVLMVAIGTAPAVAGALSRIRTHVLIEYGLFIGIFGLAIPWVANTQ